MRVLLLQDAGYHEKNKHLREALTLQKGFQDIGHHCDVWGREHPHCNFSVLPNFDSYDFIIDLWEVYHSRLDLSSVKTKKFLWSCDAHVQGEQIYIDIMKQGKYDSILSNAQGLFKTVNSHWIKPWIDLNFIKKKHTDKKTFLGFCGNRNPQRNEYIDKLTDEFNLHQDIFVIGDDMVNAINSYEIHFNKNLGYPHGFAYRIAETLACGSVLLTNESYMNEMVGLKDKQNCLIYTDYDDIKDKLNWVLEDREKRVKKLSDAGYELRHQFSTTETAKKILEVL